MIISKYPGKEMHRLQKFVEQGAYSEKPGRTAYTFGPGNLPEPGENLE